MRSVIAALPLLALAACGGASGPQTVGGIAAPAGGSSSGGTGGGIGGSTGGTTTTPTPTPANLLDVSAETTFNAIGSFHSLEVAETGVYALSGPVLYQGNAATVRAPSGTVNYNPRDGIFTVQFTDSKAGIATGVTRFQDPAHRTDYGGSASPEWGVPTGLSDFNYLEAVGPTSRAATATDLGRIDSVTFFYQRPGSQTKYVSLAGYVRNAFDRTADPVVFKDSTTSTFQRGAMVFGSDTLRSQIPTAGTGTYTGGLLASMIVNTTIDSSNRMPNYFQWITGSSTVTLDFGKQTMAMMLTGTVLPATYGGQIVPANQTGVPGGATFEAKGSGTISLTSSGGFTGSFGGTDAAGLANYVRFVNGATTTAVNTTSVSQGTSAAGASSIDGAFFGPNAVNVGGNLRIVGGTPDQRVDILGAFTGAKQP